MSTTLRYPKGFQFFDSNGNPLALGSLYYYVAGTTTLQDTYSDSAGTIPNTNPIVLDGSGRLQTDVFLGSTQNYKEVLTTSAIVVTPWPDDNIPRATTITVFTGDTGSGGASGLVPAPAAGDALANKFLKADGTWTVPPSAAGGATTLSATPTATTVQIASSTGSGATLSAATSSLAGVLDSARAAKIDGLGTLASLSSISNTDWSGAPLSISNGGTGQSTATGAFNALSPMTTAGDLIYGGTSGAGTRLGIGTAGQVLTVASGAPVWGAPPAAGSTGQLQFNNGGALAGMTGVTWDPTYQRLSIIGKNFSPSYGTGATVTISQTYDTHGLKIVASGGGNALSVVPADTSAWPEAVNGGARTYIDSAGGYYSQAYIIVSGAYTGTGNSLRVTPPSNDATMLGLWADVANVMVSRVWPMAGGRHYLAMDMNGKYVFQIDPYGGLGWAGSSSTIAFDTNLSRVGAGTLALGNGTAGDSSGTLKCNILTLNNNGALQGTTTGGTAVNLIQLDSGNGLSLGSGVIGGSMALWASAGYEIRFLNSTGARRMMSLQESTSFVTVGNSGSVFDGTLQVYDGTATTGDTMLSLRDGAARAARLRFGTGGTWDVGFTRAAANVLAVTDASTTLTNYSDLRLRNLFAGGATDAGSGVGVIALANAATSPSTNPAAGAVLYAEGGVVKSRSSSGAVVNFANVVQTNVSANLTAGYTDTIYANGTISSGTITPSVANGNEQNYTNNGAHTLAPPAVTAGQRVRLCITVTNGASAGAITVSGFSQTDTSAYVTTAAKVFDFYIMAENGFSTLKVVARP